MLIARFRPLLLCISLLLVLGGCGTERGGTSLNRALTPTDAVLIRHHLRVALQDIATFISRLYARNPKYEPNEEVRERKLEALFSVRDSPLLDRYRGWASNQLLAAAFACETEGDRILLLGQGLLSSLREAYGLEEIGLFVSGLQVPLERLKRLHFNLSQVNWRLKTYKDEKGELLFLTNGMGENGYLNMGYEVLMTRILTRIEDDIFMCGGLPDRYAFKMSTLFLSLVM